MGIPLHSQSHGCSDLDWENPSQLGIEVEVGEKVGGLTERVGDLQGDKTSSREEKWVVGLEPEGGKARLALRASTEGRVPTRTREREIEEE